MTEIKPILDLGGLLTALGVLVWIVRELLMVAKNDRKSFRLELQFDREACERRHREMVEKMEVMTRSLTDLAEVFRSKLQ